MPEKRGVLLYTCTLPYVEKARTNLAVFVDILKLLCQLIDKVLHFHLRKHLTQPSVGVAVLTPPGQGIPGKVGHHEPASVLPPEAHTADVLTHGKNKIFQVSVLATKPQWLLQFHIVR